MSRNYNLVLVTRKGQRRHLGKVCEYQDRLIYHYWGRAAEMRLDSGCWGIRRTIFDHCLAVHVEQYCIYAKDRVLTYRLPLSEIPRLDNGTGKTDDFGETINVAEECWEIIPGLLPSLPHIPDAVVKVLPVAPTQPRSTSDPTPSPGEPEPTQPPLL